MGKDIERLAEIGERYLKFGVLKVVERLEFVERLELIAGSIKQEEIGKTDREIIEQCLNKYKLRRETMISHGLDVSGYDERVKRATQHLKSVGLSYQEEQTRGS